MIQSPRPIFKEKILNERKGLVYFYIICIKTFFPEMNLSLPTFVCMAAWNQKTQLSKFIKKNKMKKKKMKTVINSTFMARRYKKHYYEAICHASALFSTLSTLSVVQTMLEPSRCVFKQDVFSALQRNDNLSGNVGK